MSNTTQQMQIAAGVTAFALLCGSAWMMLRSQSTSAEVNTTPAKKDNQKSEANSGAGEQSSGLHIGIELGGTGCKIAIYRERNGEEAKD